MVPHRIVQAEADEPAEQQVVVNLLDQLALRAHRKEHPQQQRTQPYSGAIKGRPSCEDSASNSELNERNTLSVDLRTLRKG